MPKNQLLIELNARDSHRLDKQVKMIVRMPAAKADKTVEVFLPNRFMTGLMTKLPKV
jgi:ribosomal protein S10